MNTRTIFRKENGKLRISQSGRHLSRLMSLVLLLGIFAFGKVQAQTTVTIGTGTSTHYYTPVNNYYNYTYTQTLFTAAEFQAQGITPGVPQTISSIAYNYSYSSAMTSKTNCTIYMGHTSATSFSSTSDALPLSSLTRVYTGNLNCSQGWTTFTLSTPFVWDGVNSLVVAVDDNSGSYNGSSYTYYYTSASANRAMWFYSDGTNPDPSNLSSFSGSTSVSANRTNTRFVMTPLTCPGTTAPTISGNTVTWTEMGTATRWALEYGSSGFTPGTGTRVVINNTPSYTLPGLTSGTVYDIYVRSLCSSTDSSGVKKVSFLNNPSFNCGGTGTRNDPYLICSEADLRQLSTYVNAGASFNGVYFKLAVNIQMQQGAFTPIGSPTTPFEGTFFGAGHSITNLTMANAGTANRGLFGYVRGAYIDSVTVGGNINGGDKSGAIVGEADNSTIRYCTNNASVQGSYQYHGGIVGYMNASIVEDCKNTALISDAAYYHAGIVGYSTGASVIRRCKNTGTINGYSYYHSGICGYMTNSALTNGIGIFNCTNSGAVTGSYYTGGICGDAINIIIDTCSNRNILYGYYYVGGICGRLYPGKILHCSNVATITNNSSSYTGGIVGYSYGNSSEYCYVQYCVNSGEVTSTSDYVGGITGYNYYGYVDYCSNSADVNITSTSSYCGGICGYASTYGYIRYCLNGGLITSTGNYVGGITGYSYGSSYVTYCLNVNNVYGGSGYTNVAAIAGTGAVGTTCYWDRQMCPTTNWYGTTTGAYSYLTNQLKGTATYPSATYFDAAPNMYPMPKGISDSIQAKLAATPVNIDPAENVNTVQTNFTVYTGNNVVWTSSLPTVVSINNTNATVNNTGTTQFSGTVDGLVKHVNIQSITFPHFCGGSGTQADPYLICQPSTLDSLRMFVNSGVSCAGLYFRVVRNLDMSAYSSNWNATVSGTMGPIGASTATPFSGHFDGAGFTISNITINSTANYKGLFGYVVGSSSDTAEVHDFTFSGSVTGGSYTGGIVGYANYTKMYNLVNNAPVASTSYSYHGGVCGYSYQGCVFDSCTNTAAVSGSSYTGGITGYAYYGTKFENCTNTGAVTSTSSYIGGIVGYWYPNSSVTAVRMYNCINRANVTGTYYTGGMAGYAYYYAKFFNCKNYGNVSSTSYGIGGIAGYHYYYGIMENCENYGNVSGSYYVAGLAGYEYVGSSTASYRVYNCKNEGNVSGTSYYVGGLVGYGYYSKISNSINRGNVSGASYGVGGLIGYNYYYSTVNNSINYGDVTSSYNSTTFTSSGYGTGGIVGSHNYGTSTSTVAISHCKNYGNVSSMAYGTGGIIGQCYYYPGYIEYCENYGDVTGTYYTGGITGFNRGTYSSSYYGYLRYCANAGDVTGTYYVGGIAGRNGYTSSGYYAYVTGCVNIGRISGSSYVGGIVGQNYGYSSSYPAYVQGCLNSGIVSGTSNYVGGITGYNYSSYAQNQYNLNVANVISSASYVGAVEGYSSVPTGCYYDTLMCPRSNYYYGGNAGTTYAKRTSYLTSGSFTPSATYFTATPGLYPRPTQIKDSTIAILAATPVFLDETTRPTNHVNNVNICFTVGTANNVSWTSSLPTVASIVGANGTPLSIGNTTATVSRDSCERDVDLRVSALPPVSSTFSYDDDIDGEAGRAITSVSPTSSFSGCKFVMASQLPAGLVLDTATGEISGTSFELVNNQTLIVRAICSGCNIAEARLNCSITPAIICASDSIELPAGYQWYYDSALTIPVPNKVGGLASDHRYYAVDTTSFGLLGIYDFTYTGAMQTHTVPQGVTQIEMEVWGAQGGSGSNGYVGGKGGYSVGAIANARGINNLYVFVGGQGTGVSGTASPGGWNGGGNGMFYSSYYGGGGGGGTDIRINGTSFNDRVIVAGGGGGAGPSYGSVQPAGCGGGEYGGDGYYNNTTGTYPTASNRDGSGGSPTAGGIGYLSQSGTQGSFGQGGNASTYACGGGGGGWYGGGGAYDNDSDSDGRYGGGGSGYVWTSSTAGNAPSGYSVPASYYLSNAQTIAGNSSFDSPNGSTETGHTGNGYARITEYGYLTMSYLVRVRPTPTAEISGDTTICNNDSARLQIVFTGTAPYHYRITGDNSDRTSNSDTAIVYVKPATSTYYYVTYAEYQNCEALPLDLMGRAVVGICGEQVICDGDSITLSAGNWYLDSFYTIPVSASVVHPTTTTTYYNYNGSTLKAIVYPRPTVTIPTAYDSICDGASITLPITFTGTAPFYYLLAGDSTYRVSFTNNEVLRLSPVGSIVYQVLDLYDVYCTAQYSDRNGVYTVNVCDQPIICAGDTVILPSNRPWYYDAAYTQRVPDTIVNPTITTTYYSPAISPSDTVDYTYTGAVDTFVVPAGVDSIFLQVWGAQGANSSYHSALGGKGGYSEGTLSVTTGELYYIYVGGQGSTGSISVNGGWNGGGGVTSSYSSGASGDHLGSGGGATDISRVGGACTLDSYNRYVRSTASYNGRVIVAGGGGGAEAVSGTAGGGLSGIGTYPGTQNAAGAANIGTASSWVTLYAGGLGYGVSTTGGHTNHAMGACGGGGYYGGGALADNGSNAQGFGGSGYVGSLTNARTVAGNQSFLSPSGTMETGHSGNGHARISYVSANGGAPSMTYTVRVNPIPTATITGIDTACDNAPANLIINFTGAAPYVYHIVGELGSRMSYNNTAYVPIIPDTVSTYRLDMISDANCVGTINNCFGQAAIYRCGQDVICQGDSVALPLPYTWCTDRGLRNYVMTAKVAPRTTTTYYRQGQNGAVVEHLVIVKPRPVARIISSDTTICGGSAAIRIRFSGNAPYTYRFTGESADRISWTDTMTNYVSPQYITRYNISQISDQFCVGSPAPISDEITVMICNQQIICDGDSVQLPNGHWFFDSLGNQPVPSNNMVAPRTNQTYYLAGEETYNYAYTGHTEVLPLPSNVDSVKMEVWGAQGGYRSNSSYAGKGGYAYGTLTNVAGLSNLYINVGQHPGNSSSLSSGDQPGGWNGGGYRYGYKGGGGATDIAIAGVPGSIVWNTQQHLYSRIIVAGGGGSDGGTSYAGGAAGVSASGGCSYNSSACGYAGNATYSGPGSAYTATTQTTTGLNAGNSTATGWYGGFGFGGAGYYYSSGYGGAGGGGWYGGCGTMPDGSVDDDRGGGGGSGYVWTAATASSVPAGYMPTPNYYLVNAGVKGGSESFNSPSGASETGHPGNGAARITVYSTGSYTIVVQPRPTATISARGIVCGHNGTYLDINFAGYAPFTYRLVGDSADRVCYSNHDSIYVCPSTITNYRLATLSDNYCVGQASDFPGIATVNVCAQTVICHGDTFVLDPNELWYYDQALRLPLSNNNVSPDTTTRYYSSPYSWMTVNVNPAPTATILTPDTNICGSGIDVRLEFTGTFPFRYRMMGDTADRISYSNHDVVHMDPTATTRIGLAFVEDAFCQGTILNGSIMVTLCNQPIICAGDTVQLPAGTWYYDAAFTQPVPSDNLVAPTSTTIYYMQALQNFSYTGREQTYVVPQNVTSVEVQVWGAEGGDGQGSSSGTAGGAGGLGGYSRGTLPVNPGDILYVYVGQKGEDAQNSSSVYTYTSSFNGGGAAGMHNYTSYYYNGGSGGGATDVRVNSNSLYARAIVAGGGGGGGYSTSYYGGYGGGTAGGHGYNSTGADYGQGGTQSAGGNGATNTYAGESGSFGLGGQGGPYQGSYSVTGGGGGGGGWYGGGGGKSGNSSSCYPGGGGSGYVYTSASASNYPSGCLLNSYYYMTNTTVAAGNTSFESPTGTTETGHTGNGYARIIGATTYTVAVNSVPTATLVNGYSTICNNANGVTLTITFSGTAPYTYRLTGDTYDRVTNNRVEVITLNPTQSMNYQVVYLHDAYCEAVPQNLTGLHTVIVCDQPIICAGDTVELPTRYNWYYDSNLVNPVTNLLVSPATTTTYYRQGATYTVTVNQRPSARISGTSYICGGNSATLTLQFTGAFPITYRITGDRRDRTTNTPTVRIQVTPSVSTNYTVTMLRDQFCEGIATDMTGMARISVCEEPTICAGDSVYLPSGQWYYDSLYTNPVLTGNVVAPDSTTTYYARAAGSAVDFQYTGSLQTYTVPAGVDSVFMQVWGAQGGQTTYSSYLWYGGKGGYSEGKMHVTPGTTLYVRVGGAGGNGTTGTGTAAGGYNGGGSSGTTTNSTYFYGGAGGGGTDICVGTNSNYARAIVAGGGGGAAYGPTTTNTINGGAGGGVSGQGGIPNTSYATRVGAGGTAVSGGAAGTYTAGNGTAGTFGQGGTGGNGDAGGAGGGGGWYGGGGGNYGSQMCGPAGGGSGYVYTAATAANYPAGCLLNSSYYLTNATTIAGTSQFYAPDSTMETGHSGNGYAKITAIGSAFNTYTVHVYDKPTSVLIGGDTICDNDTAMLVVNFTGVAPFIYRLTGETQNRVCNSTSDTIYVRPTLSTNYRVTMLYDSLCEGRPADMVGAALVVVCNQPVVCEGTAVQLDLNRTWYYDYAMTRPLTGVTVVPTTTTTYYSAEGPFTITVIPRPKASIVTDMAELCDGDSTVIVRINFTGTAPFTYRLTGDVTDRVCNGNSATLVLSPTRPIVYRVVSLYDAVCEANYTDFSGNFEVTFCNMVSVCSGDLVELPDRGSRWFLDSACTIPVPSNTIMPTSNVTYYRRAGWITRDFQYTGTVEEFIIPQGIDTIKMEVWGASGGYRTTSTNAGAGGYARGTITNTTGLTALYVYVGQSGNNVTSSTASIYPGGWNGGGYRYLYKGGGGATDIALQGTAGSNVWNSAAHFNSRIIVAGGGGSDGGSSYAGGAAGGTVGTTANSGCGTNYGGGNQTYSGTGAATTAATQVTVGLGTGALNQTYGGFGFGGAGVYYASGYGGAGGGGWYGGCGTYPDGSVDDDKGGSGGSSFVWTPATAASVPAGYTVPASAYLVNATTVSGSSSFLAPDSTNETGHRGDGYARIVYQDNTLDSFTIIVNRSYTSIYYDTMGRGEYYHFCGVPYTQGGTYSVNLYTMNGCDSTLILNLAEIDTTVEDRYINICKDETYTLRGVTYDRTGDYVNIAHHEQACDTIINLHLTIWDTTFNYIVDTICAGDTMFINGVPYFTSGHYVEYLRTVIGCDSAVDLTLTVRDTIFDIRDTLLCYEGIFEFYGNYYDRTQPGTYTHVEQSVLTGCDSVIVVNVSFRDRSDTTIWDTICENSRYNFLGNYFFNTGTYVDTLVNQYGCDSIITLNLYRLEYPSIYLRDSGAYCINGSTNLVVTTNGNTIDWVSYPVDTTMAQHHNDTVVTVAPKVKTLYTVTVDYAPYNCVSTATIMIKTPDKLEAKFVTDPNVITMPETQIKFTDQSIGTVVANKWIFPDYITENRKEAYYTSRRDDDSIQVILIVEDTNTCQDTTIQVIPVRLGEIWIPNVFMPDSKDGNHDNEIFKVVTFEVTDFEIHIYSRAGQLVFESTDPTEGWDGTHNGVKCQGGSYVYIVKYRLPRAHNQRVETRTGSVLLVR